MCVCIYIYIYKYILSKAGYRSRERHEGSLFNSYNTDVIGEGANPFPGLLHFTLDNAEC